MRLFICFLLLILIPSAYATEDAPEWDLSDHDQGWNAEDLVLEYFHHSEPQRQWAWELVGKYPLRGDEHVLDFGCGDGKLTAQLSRHLSTGSIVGVDLSASMISFARRAFSPKSYPNLSFHSTPDIDASSALDNQLYDRIYAFCVFHLLPQPEIVLRNLLSHTSPHGDLLLVIPKGGNSAFFEAATRTFTDFALKPPWESKKSQKATMRTLEGIREIISSSGWKIDSLHEVNTPYVFVNQEQFVHWLIGTVTANWKIPKTIASKFFETLVAHMEKIHPQMVTDEGTYDFVLSRVHVVAHKPK